MNGSFSVNACQDAVCFAVNRVPQDFQFLCDLEGADGICQDLFRHHTHFIPSTLCLFSTEMQDHCSVNQGIYIYIRMNMYISSNSIFLSSFILKGVKCRMFKYVWMANWCFKAMFLSDQILRTVDQRSAWMLRFVAGRQMPFWAMLASLQSLVAPHCWLINGLINGLWKGFVFFVASPWLVLVT
jgi:hypothetical protein